jgi:hypothetical protein
VSADEVPQAMMFGTRDEQAPRLTALEMALNLAGSVEQIARFTDSSPLESHVHRLGERGHQAAQLAANLALVSIAEDLHRLLSIMTGQQQPAGRRRAGDPAAEEDGQ